MNCKTVRKFLLAFVDGQLGVQMSCEVLDHLKMCPSCSAIVDGHQALRQSLKKSAEKVSVPAGMEARIRHAIEVDGIGKSRKATQPVRTFRLARSLAVAACLVIVFSITWTFFPNGLVVDGLGGGASGSGALSALDEITQRVVIRHNQCSKKCDTQSHHDPSLPSDRAQLAAAFDRQFAGALACATPDLTGYGYEFESANFCAPAADHAGPAAHVMYVNPVYGTRLSLFTVPHWGMIDVPDREPPDRHHPFVHSLADCDTNALLAWHEGSMTYILTGPVDAEAMAEMIGDLELVSSNGR